jgi:hypothetical protein
MISAIPKGLVITAALGILSNLSGLAVLFVELFGGVFRDKEMPMVIGINAGVASLICFVAFVIAACVFRPGIRLIILCGGVWLVIAAAVLWIEQRP